MQLGGGLPVGRRMCRKQGTAFPSTEQVNNWEPLGGVTGVDIEYRSLVVEADQIESSERETGVADDVSLADMYDLLS
jgi:hypothetical protein